MPSPLALECAALGKRIENSRILWVDLESTAWAHEQFISIAFVQTGPTSQDFYFASIFVFPHETTRLNDRGMWIEKCSCRRNTRLALFLSRSGNPSGMMLRLRCASADNRPWIAPHSESIPLFRRDPIVYSGAVDTTMNATIQQVGAIARCHRGALDAGVEAGLLRKPCSQH